MRHCANSTSPSARLTTDSERLAVPERSARGILVAIKRGARAALLRKPSYLPTRRRSRSSGSTARRGSRPLKPSGPTVVALNLRSVETRSIGGRRRAASDRARRCQPSAATAGIGSAERAAEPRPVAKTAGTFSPVNVSSRRLLGTHFSATVTSMTGMSNGPNVIGERSPAEWVGRVSASRGSASN